MASRMRSLDHEVSEAASRPPAAATADLLVLEAGAFGGQRRTRYVSQIWRR